MQPARRARAPFRGARRAVALVCALGSIACAGSLPSGERSSRGGAPPGQIDLTSPGGPGWPGFEPEPAAPELSDADVERIATRLPRERVPRTSSQNPSKGPVSAPVTLQIWSDFECPFCQRVAPTLADVEAEFRGNVRLVFRHYPLAAHESARPAARAALAAFQSAGNSGFWRLHDWFYSAEGDTSDAGIARAAQRLGLDSRRLLSAARGSAISDAAIDRDIAAGDAVGIQGTPAVLINDYYMMGARPFEEYSLVVRRALTQAKP